MKRPLILSVLTLIALLVATAWALTPSPSLRAPVGPRGPDSANAATGSLAGDAAEADPAAAIASPAVERVDAAAGRSEHGATTGTLNVRATWADAPAAGVVVTLRWATRERAYRVRAQQHTDADGMARFGGVPPGKWSLRSDRGDRKTVDVEPGEQEVAFELEDGVAVRGVVRAPDGAPVPGASVWLQTRHTDWSGGRTLTRTDGDGRFALAHVPPHVSLGALAAGYAQSRLVDLDTVDTSAPPAEVTLKLGGAGGGLHGVVVDATGRPVAGARVGAGRNTRFLDMRGDRVIEKWSVRSTLTDEAGRFALLGLPAGEQPVACSKQGFGVWRSTCEVVAGGDVEVDVALQRAGAIFGTVTKAEGAPFAGALVRAYDGVPGTSFLAGGQIDWDEMFGHFATVADAQGRYELPDVTAGEVHVFVQPGGRYLLDGPVVHQRTVLEVPPGGRVEWSPEVTEGRVLEGLVLYRDGHPMPNVFVTLRDEATGVERVQTNDRQGVFRFVNLDDAVYSARVQMWDAPKGAPPLQATGLRPGQGRAQLRATHDKPVKLAPGKVLGRIDDAGLRIRNPKDLRVVLASDQRWFRDGGEVEDGAFSFDRVTPCKFRLTLQQGEAVLAHSGWFELQAGAELDVGVLRTVPGGEVLVRAERGAGAEDATPTLYFRHEDASRSTVVTLTGDEQRVENLTPGRYQVTGYEKGLVAIKGEVTVTAGAVADLALTLTKGVLTKFAVWVPLEPVVARYDYTIRDAAGAEFRSYGADFGSSPTRPFPISVTMPPGRYTIDYRAGEVFEGSQSFEVTDAPATDPIRVELQRQEEPR
ncbi:MAG: carboxypeptidase regulatory-like domain-containing protein [Planctomycetota bacterium]